MVSLKYESFIVPGGRRLSPPFFVTSKITKKLWCGSRVLLGLLDDDTVFHDEGDVFQQTDVIKRVAIDGDQIC